MLDQVSLMDKLWLAQRPNNKTTLEFTSNRLFFSIAPFQVLILWPVCVCVSNTSLPVEHSPVPYSVNPRRQGSLNCHSPHKHKWQNKSQSQLPHLKVQGSNPPIQWGTPQNIGSKLRGYKYTHPCPPLSRRAMNDWNKVQLIYRELKRHRHRSQACIYNYFLFLFTCRIAACKIKSTENLIFQIWYLFSNFLLWLHYQKANNVLISFNFRIPKVAFPLSHLLEFVEHSSFSMIFLLLIQRWNLGHPTTVNMTVSHGTEWNDFILATHWKAI